MAAVALVSAQDGDRRGEEGEQQPDSTSSSEVSRQNKDGESGTASPARPSHVPRLAVEQAGIADGSQPVTSQGTLPPGTSPGSVVASTGFLHPVDPPPAVHTPAHAADSDTTHDGRWTGQSSGGSYRGAIPFASPASTSTGWEWQRTPGARSIPGDAHGAGERQSHRHGADERQSHRRKLLELSEECRSLSRRDIQSRVASLQETYTPSLLNFRTTTSQKCESVPRRARI